MADIKLGDPFGLEDGAISDADWTLALQRIIQDLKSDFIYAPHISISYLNCGPEIIAELKKDLKAGKYLPGMPITIEVPKSFRIRVATTPPRLGPTYSRPGSILLPKDRLLYQALADKAASIIETKSDHRRTFSHRLDVENPSNMFLPTRVCWNNLQNALAEYAEDSRVRYVMKIDVANFFGSLNQHTLVNVLSDAGYQKKLLSRLESILTSYTGERSSRGILQGLYPSDLLGNFYLEPIDRLLSDAGILSARYVDDIYIFLPSVDAVDKLMRDLIPALRRYDLVLNEAKSAIVPKNLLHTEEPDLDRLFETAVAEVSKQFEHDDFGTSYGFQADWEEDQEEQETRDDSGEESELLKIEATKLLFDAISQHPGHEEKIERFCLPLFSQAGSDYAVEHVLDSFKKRPAMSQIYAAYISSFLSDNRVFNFLVESIGDTSLLDWQKMWIMAALLRRKPNSDEPVKAAFLLLKDANCHDALRAIAAIYVGRFGDATRRTALRGMYSNVSPYVQAAIYFSSTRWPAPERTNARAIWGGQGALNQLITKGLAKP